MALQEQRHHCIHRLFKDDFGNIGHIYAKVPLGGKTGTKAALVSYLALYANGDLPYVLVLKEAFGRQEALRRVLTLKFPEEHAKTEAANAQALVCGSPRAVDEALWLIGVSQTSPYGLPLVLLTWMRTLDGGHPQVALWYPAATQGRWAFARLMNSVRTSEG